MTEKESINDIKISIVNCVKSSNIDQISLEIGKKIIM